LAGFLDTAPGAPLFLALGQVLADHEEKLKRLVATLPLTIAGVGIAWRVSRVVPSGFVEMGGAFDRAPKLGLEGPRREPKGDDELETVGPELLLGRSCVFDAALTLISGADRTAPPMGFFIIAFAAVAGIALQNR
jgi:hypothetical protein